MVGERYDRSEWMYGATVCVDAVSSCRTYWLRCQHQTTTPKYIWVGQNSPYSQGWVPPVLGQSGYQYSFSRSISSSPSSADSSLNSALESRSRPARGAKG